VNGLGAFGDDTLAATVQDEDILILPDGTVLDDAAAERFGEIMLARAGAIDDDESVLPF
jgi:hypothetical protein